MTKVQACETTALKCAQRLVTTGYFGQLRRNYLIQLVNDDEDYKEACSPQAPAGAKTAFEVKRQTSWVTHGVLPVAVFRTLLAAWAKAGHLAAAGQATHANFTVDVGITFEGLLQLGTHEALTDLFRRKAPAYAQGAYWRAASRLGDSGPSAPLKWNERYQKKNLHAVLIFHTSRSAEEATVEKRILEFEADILCKLAATLASNLQVMKRDWIESSQKVGKAKEIHFGLVDGLSMPRYHGVDSEVELDVEAEVNRHLPGELLLGYNKNDGSNPWLVPNAVVRASRPATISPLSVQEIYGSFFKDGAFGVLRRMYQNVPKFESTLMALARAGHGAHSLEYYCAWLKAKMLGRWPNGERVLGEIDPSIQGHLTLLQAARMIAVYEQGNSATSNNFVYQMDRQGLQCPFGAHIRRMNPRDDPVAPRLRRPLLRRGLPYGEKFDLSKKNEADDRGLLGLFFCTSIEEQFEHLLGNWANNNPMGMPFTQAGKDPLIAAREPNDPKGLRNSFAIPNKDAPPLFLNGLQTFVETRGTSYAFFPSLNALQKISDGAVGSQTAFIRSP